MIIKFIKVKKGSILRLLSISWKNWEDNQDNSQLHFCEGVFTNKKEFEDYKKEQSEVNCWVIFTKQEIWKMVKEENDINGNFIIKI